MEFPKPTNRQTAKEKQRSRYETLIFTRLVLLVAVPLLIVGLLCGILYYRSEFARGRAKLGEVAGNASMRMTSVFDGLRSYYLAALRNSSFTWMESCSEIPYSRYSDLRDAQELLRGGTYMDSYVVGYEYINLRYGWVLSNYGTFPLEQMKNQEEIRTFIDNQASQTATLYWVNRTGAAPVAERVGAVPRGTDHLGQERPGGNAADPSRYGIPVRAGRGVEVAGL